MSRYSADIAERLDWYARNTTMLSARPILKEAAAEVRRLRLSSEGAACEPPGSAVMLTDAELLAVAAVAASYQRLCDEYGPSDEDEETLATLRRLLGRVKCTP
jgi:hypothetical protein